MSAKATVPVPVLDERVWQRTLDVWERSIANVVEQFLERQRAVVMARVTGARARQAIERGATLDPTAIVDAYRWRQEFAAEIRTEVTRIYETIGAEMMARFGGVEDPIFLTDESVQADISATVTAIVDTQGFEENIVAAMNEAKSKIQTKDDLDDLADRLDSMYRSRARSFGARAGRAAPGIVNGASHHAARQSPNVRSKSWVTVGDDKVRRTHADANGQSVAGQDVFDVGGVLMRYPGDPTAPVAETVNCRCTVAYETAERTLQRDFEQAPVQRTGITTL